MSKNIKADTIRSGYFDLSKQLTKYEIEHLNKRIKSWKKIDKPNIIWTVNLPRQLKGDEIMNYLQISTTNLFEN